MQQIEIVTSLLFRIEEACVHTGGRIHLLASDYIKIRELQEAGYIQNHHPLPKSYSHDNCTHVAWLTEEGWIEACKLRRQLANMASNYYYLVMKDAQQFGEEVVYSRLNKPYGNLYSSSEEE